MTLTVNGAAVTPADIYVSGYPDIVSSRIGDVEAHGVCSRDGWSLIALNAGDEPATVAWNGDEQTVPPRRSPGTYGVARFGAPLSMREDARDRLRWMLEDFDMDGPRFPAVQKEDIYPNTGQKGSPRMAWGCVLPAVSALWGYTPSLASLIAWCDKQLTHRAVHEIQPPRDNGAPAWEGDGHWRSYDTQHFTMDQLAALAALTNDPGAWISLRWHAEAAIYETYRAIALREDNNRANGWLLLALGTAKAMSKGKNLQVLDAIDALANYLDHSHERQADEGFVIEVPHVIANKSGRNQEDHGYCAISPWMTAPIGLGAIRCELTHRPLYQRAVDSMRYAASVSDHGPGTFVTDYDDGRARQDAHPWGSHSELAMVKLLCWLSGEADLRAHVAEFHSRADCMRQADGNAKRWLTHVVGKELGYR